MTLLKSSFLGKMNDMAFEFVAIFSDHTKLCLQVVLMHIKATWWCDSSIKHTKRNYAHYRHNMPAFTAFGGCNDCNENMYNALEYS